MSTYPGRYVHRDSPEQRARSMNLLPDGVPFMTADLMLVGPYGHGTGPYCLMRHVRLEFHKWAFARVRRALVAAHEKVGTEVDRENKQAIAEAIRTAERSGQPYREPWLCAGTGLHHVGKVTEQQAADVWNAAMEILGYVKIGGR